MENSTAKPNFLNNKILVLLSAMFFIFLSPTAFSQDKKALVKEHYSSKNVQLFDKKSYTLSGFDKKLKNNVPLDVLKLIDEPYLNHPDLGVSFHPYEKDAIELVDKRDIFHSTYLRANGQYIFSSSKDPLNYLDENGWYREIRYELEEKPVINDVYRAPYQAIPKTIDAKSGKTTFETPMGNISINQESKLRFFNGIKELGTNQSLNMSQKEIGKNGLFVSNAYSNIDMQVILMANGYIKTNYIIKDRSAINSNAEFMVFEDVITLPEGLHFDFDTEKGIHNGNESDWEGELVVRDDKNRNIFHYLSPFIYDNNYTEALINAPLSTYSELKSSVEEPGVESESFTYGAYRVEKINANSYKVSVVVKTFWLLDNERTFPLVIDPVTFTGNTYTFNTGIDCARRVSGTTPVDNPGPAGVGCYSSTVVLPAGYMLISSQAARLFSGYKTRGCAASSTWMTYYGPCGQAPRQSGFFYFCNTNLTNVDCGAPAGGNPTDFIFSRCLLSGGEDCLAASAPSCANQTLTVNVCYQTRCSANAAGTCATTSTRYPTAANASYVEPGIANFRMDVLGEKIAITLAGSPASGSNICPSIVVPLTLTTRFGVPNALSTANCTDQMGGTYTITTTCTGGTLSANTNAATNTTGGFNGAATWTAPAAAGTYTITTTVCNTNCPAPAGTMCDNRTLTYIVGNAIAPIVANITACDGVSATAAISNLQGGYTYTWYTNAAGTTGAATGNSRVYAAVNGTTQTYSVRATSPCASTLTTFTITWGPLAAPIGSGDLACPGQPGTLTANCGGNCRWYTLAAGGVALTSVAPITVASGSLTVDPVSTTVTYYVENYVSAGCISARTPLTISTNALTVTTNPTSIDPICSPSTAAFSSSVTGNTNVANLPICNAGSNTIEDGSACTGGDCTGANSGQLTVTTPAGVASPLLSTSIVEVCFQTNTTAICGKEAQFFLTSPSGTTFTLYSGRVKNDKTQANPTTLCFNDLASSTVFAPSMGAGVNIPAGDYLADGGVLGTAFLGETATLGSVWTLSVVDNLAGGCGSGTATVSNFCLTFGVNSPPTYLWTGGPAGGLLNNYLISGPTFTPPVGTFNSTYTVTVTDAVGCTGTATVGVVCTTLPIELLSFYGDVGDRENYLYWKTASEKNSAYFDVERSTNAIDFEFIGKVKAATNSNTLKEYGFTDKNRKSGVNYYRLKAIDLDGQYKYSETIALETKDQNISIELIPNPATTMIDIKYVMNFATETDIKIYDVKGSLIRSFKHNSEKGVNSVVLDLDAFSKGVYSVVVNNDGVVSTSKFIKE